MRIRQHRGRKHLPHQGHRRPHGHHFRQQQTHLRSTRIIRRHKPRISLTSSPPDTKNKNTHNTIPAFLFHSPFFSFPHTHKPTETRNCLLTSPPKQIRRPRKWRKLRRHLARFSSRATTPTGPQISFNCSLSLSYRLPPDATWRGALAES